MHRILFIILFITMYWLFVVLAHSTPYFSSLVTSVWNSKPSSSKSITNCPQQPTVRKTIPSTIINKIILQSGGRIVHCVVAKRPGGETSWGRNVQGANWQRGETSSYPMAVVNNCVRYWNDMNNSVFVVCMWKIYSTETNNWNFYRMGQVTKSLQCWGPYTAI